MSLLRDLATIGFTIWGIYKGYWVCRKVYKFLKFKYDCWAAEEAYVTMLAAQIRMAQEDGQNVSVRNY